MKKKNKIERYWYRAPKHKAYAETVFQNDIHLIIPVYDASKELDIAKAAEFEKEVIKLAAKFELAFLDTKTFYEDTEAIKTKKVQEQERFEEEFRKAVFYECGAQEYL